MGAEGVGVSLTLRIPDECPICGLAWRPEDNLAVADCVVADWVLTVTLVHAAHAN